MDIISIWSQWHTLTPAQVADKEFVQKVKGTKVTYTIFSNVMPEPFASMYDDPYCDEAIEAYAKAYCKDSMDKWNYDGIDIDYELGFGAVGPFVGNPAPELFNKLIVAMGKYVGPKSGTGRLVHHRRRPLRRPGPVCRVLRLRHRAGILLVRLHRPAEPLQQCLQCRLEARASISSPRTSSPTGRRVA